MSAKIGLVAIMAPALLSAAPMNPFPGIDRYLFEKKDFTRSGMALHVREYKTREALRESFVKLFPGKPYPIGLLAFARWNDYACEIHIMDPAVRYEPHVVGHEMTHCIHGNFHPSRDRK